MSKDRRQLPPLRLWRRPPYALLCSACRNGAQKLLGVLITIGEAVAYVVSGMYGDVRELGAGNAILIIVQVGADASWAFCT